MHYQHIYGWEDQSIPGIIYNTSIDGTRECRSEFGRRINFFPLWHIYEFFVLYDQIGPVRKTFCESFDGLPERLPTWGWGCQTKYHFSGKVIQLVRYETKVFLEIGNMP